MIDYIHTIIYKNFHRSGNTSHQIISSSSLVCGLGSSAMYPPNALSRPAYGSAAAGGTTMLSSSSSSLLLLCVASSAAGTLPPFVCGGASLPVSTRVVLFGPVAALVPAGVGSEGPGPGTTTAPGGICGRAMGTSTWRERGFSAGLSARALPVALRMNVCQSARRKDQATSREPMEWARRTSGFLW